MTAMTLARLNDQTPFFPKRVIAVPPAKQSVIKGDTQKAFLIFQPHPLQGEASELVSRYLHKLRYDLAKTQILQQTASTSYLAPGG
jgi:hypothetical protein